MAAHIDVLVRRLDSSTPDSERMAVESVRIRKDARKLKTTIQMLSAGTESPPKAVVVQVRAAARGSFNTVIGAGETGPYSWDRIKQSSKVEITNDVPETISPAAAVQLLIALIDGRTDRTNIELGNLQSLHGVDRYSSLGQALTLPVLGPILSAASDFDDLLARMELLQLDMWHLLSIQGSQVQHSHLLRPLTEVYTGDGLTVLDIGAARLTADTGLMPSVKHNDVQDWKQRDAVALWLDDDNRRRTVRLSEQYRGRFGALEDAVLVDYEWESEETAILAATLGIAGARASALQRSIEYYAQSNADVAALATAAYAIDGDGLYYRIDGLNIDLESLQDTRASWARIGLELAYLGYQKRTRT